MESLSFMDILSPPMLSILDSADARDVCEYMDREAFSHPELFNPTETMTYRILKKVCELKDKGISTSCAYYKIESEELGFGLESNDSLITEVRQNLSFILFRTKTLLNLVKTFRELPEAEQEFVTSIIHKLQERFKQNPLNTTNLKIALACNKNRELIPFMSQKQILLRFIDIEEEDPVIKARFESYARRALRLPEETPFNFELFKEIYQSPHFISAIASTYNYYPKPSVREIDPPLTLPIAAYAHYDGHMQSLIKRIRSDPSTNLTFFTPLFDTIKEHPFSESNLLQISDWEHQANMLLTIAWELEHLKRECLGKKISTIPLGSDLKHADLFHENNYNLPVYQAGMLDLLKSTVRTNLIDSDWMIHLRLLNTGKENLKHAILQAVDLRHRIIYLIDPHGLPTQKQYGLLGKATLGALYELGASNTRLLEKLGPEESWSIIEPLLTFNKLPKQGNNNLCSEYCIAYAWDLIHNQNPSLHENPLARMVSIRERILGKILDESRKAPL